MTRRLVMIAAVLLTGPWPVVAASLDWSGFEKAKFGGRFEYFGTIDDLSNPVPWNSATHAADDRTRLMVDLNAMNTGVGSFYAKAAAFWGENRITDIQKKVRFEQGDYLWDQDLTSWNYSLRLFANERRFFVGDMIAPLLVDDRAGETGDNRGARVDGVIKQKVELSMLYSLLGDDINTSREVAFARGAYLFPSAVVSLSYLLDDPGASGFAKRATFKTEVSATYKKFFTAITYQQSEMKDADVFFPSGSFKWDRYKTSDLRGALPPGAAVFAEARIKAINIRDAGKLRLVWDYRSLGEEFSNDLGWSMDPDVGHTAGAYFLSNRVSLHGKLLYHHSTRQVLEDEKRDGVEGSIWGHLKDGGEFFVRGGVGNTRDSAPFNTKQNYAHTALQYQLKRFRTGAHVMWKDVDTIFSERRFAWDGKLALSPNWGVHWRFLLSREFSVNRTVFGRLEYRPSDRIFAHITIGRDFLGDEPFLLEDRDIGLSRSDATIYSITLRGDF